MLDVERTPGRETLDALPIFPLPNVVFLPGMVLPLNVFEPRYLELVDHVLAGGMHVGVPLVRPAGLDAIDRELPVHDPGGGLPAIEAIFGIGRLISHQQLADGRRVIRLEGLGRVQARAELDSPHPFRQLIVDPLPEDQPQDRHALDVLRAQVERMAETFDAEERQMIHAVLELDDARVVIYAIASLVPNVELMRAVQRGLPVGEQLHHLRLQQRCLAALDADRRVQLLGDRAQVLIDVLGESGRFPVSMMN